MLANPAIRPLPANEPKAIEEPDRQLPRLGLWHAGLWAVLVCLFSAWSVKWVIDWETTRGRVAPTNRLIWNAMSIHSGPFAGVYYWDYGDSRPSLVQRTRHLCTSRFRSGHRAIVSMALPVCALLLWPATGWGLQPVRRSWRIAFSVAFLTGTGLWYFSAMVSIAMLS